MEPQHRAVLSVIVQRGGKLPTHKPKCQRHIDDNGVEVVQRYKVEQFRSGLTNPLLRAGWIRQRRIFWEITKEGREALNAAST